jgi:arsenite methyltransferase
MAVARFDARAAARLERVYSAPSIVEQRARTRAALAVRAGERGLEIGCGPGLLAVEVARELGVGGRVVALDASPEMLAHTAARAEREGVADRVALVRGDARHLSVRDAAFDWVVAVQVYLYVAEIDAALADAGRVLRPGGRLVIVDTDWDSCVWLTADPARHRRMLDVRLAQYAQPHLPPHLPGLLRDAGLVLEHLEAIPIVDLRYDPTSFSGDMVGVVRGTALRAGIAEDVVRAWEADLTARTSVGDYFFCVNRFLFVARRP